MRLRRIAGERRIAMRSWATMILCASVAFLASSLVAAQQFSLTSQAASVFGMQLTLCAITPPAATPLGVSSTDGRHLDPASDWSGDAVSHQGNQQCFRNANQPGYLVPDNVRNAVWTGHNCVMNSTAGTEGGYATCDGISTITTLPFQVLTAHARDGAAILCALFLNGTIGCNVGGFVGFHYPLEGLGIINFGYSPKPMEFVNATADPPVAIRQFVQPLDANNLGFVCVLLTNHSVRCGVTDELYSPIVYDAPKDPGPGEITPKSAFRIVQMCAGVNHVCVLYESGTPYCWSGAGGCLGGACSAPSSVLFSSIDCGGAFTCGVRIDGGISCWGSPLMSNALSPPSGVFSAVIVSQQMPCAVSAIDASVQCWGSIADSYSGEALVLPTMSVVRASWLCALRKRHNPALTPSIACWSEDGRAAGMMYLPAELTHTAFHSIAVTSFYICMQFAADRTVRCNGNHNHPYASLFTLVPADLGPVREIGVVPGSEQMWVWGQDGRLMSFGHTGYPHYLYPILPTTVNNNTEMLWKSFHIAGQQGQALCGILTNGTALCVDQNNVGTSCASLPTVDEALAIMQNGVANSTLHFLSLHISTIYSVCPNICGIVSDGRAVCWGLAFSPVAHISQNSSILTFDLQGEPAVQIITQQVFNGMLSDPGFAICVLGALYHTYCWTLHLGGGLVAAPGPDQLITEMFADADTLLFGKMLINDELISWNPSGINVDGRIATLPGIALQVAPQFHYRYRAGPVLPCPPGTFSLGVGSITHVCSGLCAAGRYGNASLNTNAACAGACPRGYYCPAGTALPIPCPAGSYGDQEGLVNAGCSGSCLPGFYCPAGSWLPDAHPCPSGFVSKQPDQPCVRCDRNTYSGLAPSSECTPCPPNSFAPTDGLSSCLACPSSGIECGLGSAMILEGHWAHISNLSATDSFDANEFGPFVCPPDYCDGGGDTQSFSPDVAAPLVNPCSPHRSLDPANPLCGRCDAGYWEWNSVCTTCPPVNWGILAALILLSFFVVIVLHVLSQRSTSSARLSILIFFAQTALLLLRARSAGELGRVFAWMHVFNLSITAPTGSTCLAQLSGQQTMMLEGFLPLASLLPLMVLASLRWCWMRCACCAAARGGGAPSHASAAAFEAAPPLSASAAYALAHRPFPWHEYVRTAITVSLIAYQQLCVTTLAYLQCVPVGPYRVVFSRPSIDCTSTDYLALQPFAILLIICLAGMVPAALVLFLYKHRDTIWKQQTAMMAAQAQAEMMEAQKLLQKQHATSDHHPAAGRDGAYSPPPDRSQSPSFPDSVAVLPDPVICASGFGLEDADGDFDESVPASLVSSSAALQFTRRFSALYLSYKPASYLWLPVLLLRRVALVMCAVLLLTLPDYQQLAFSLLCLLILCTHVFLHPFSVELDNRLETMSLLALLAISQVLASQTGSPADASMPIAVQLLAGAMLVCPLATILFFIVQFNLQRPAARAMLRVLARQFPWCAGLCAQTEENARHGATGAGAAGLDRSSSPPLSHMHPSDSAAGTGSHGRARSSGGSVSLENSQGFASSSSLSGASLKALQAQMRAAPPMRRSPSPRDRNEQQQAEAKASLLANAHHP